MEKEIVIYTITSLYLNEDVVNSVDPKNRNFRDLDYRSSLVAVYKDLLTAKKCVEEDWPGFDESGYYNYIVIEGLNEGCYPGLGENETWYRHDYDNRKWIPCEKPEVVSSTVNFYS